MNSSNAKIVDKQNQLEPRLAKLARPLVFTNGCFDILHRGHVAYLEEAATLGNSLVVGINSDSSVRKLEKGRDRPINSLDDRAAVLAGLGCIDLVVAFDEETPLSLIERLRPDHLVKGGDWAEDRIVGAREVKAWGGKVHSVPIRYKRSTSELIQRILAHG